MSNMTIKLDILPVRDKLTTRLFGALVSKFNPNTNERVNASALESLGLSYDYLKESMDRRGKNILTPVLQTALEHIDYMAEKYVLDNNCSFKTTEARFENGYALEDAGDAAFEVEDGDITSGIIADMIEDLSKKHSTEIKDLAKYILKLEKDKQGDDRAMAEEEDNEYVEEDETFEPDSEGNGEGGDGDSDNPFGNDSDSNEGEQESGEGEQESNGDDANPFGDDSGDNNGGDETSSSGDDSNPFGGDDNESSDQGSSDGGQTNEGGDSDGGNPFADSSEGESNDNGSSDGDSGSGDSNLNSDNPFESYMASVSKGAPNATLLGAVGIESGDVLAYVNNTVSKEYKSDMQKLFEEYGMESNEFKAKQNEYVKVSEAAVESICASIATMFGLGLPLDLGRLKYYQ